MKCTAMLKSWLKRLRHDLEEQTSETLRNVTASYGVYASRAGETFDDAVKKADLAVYHAKKSGRNRVCVFFQKALQTDHLVSGQNLLQGPVPVMVAGKGIEIDPFVFADSLDQEIIKGIVKQAGFQDQGNVIHI